MMKFYDILDKVVELYKKNNVLWFRGHKNLEYKLNSSLYRISKDRSEIVQYECNLYNAFVNYGDRFLHSFRDNNEWNTLFLMQHYGVYTRLLDWTSSFSTALYFANYNRKANEIGVIWVLNPKKMNISTENLYEDNEKISPGIITLESLPNRVKKYTGYFEENLDISSFAIMPPMNNERLLLQHGFFTVQGTKGIPLENELESICKECLFKIELPYEIFEYSNQYLNIHDINKFSLFGDADNLADYIRNDLLKIEFRNL